MGINMGIFFAVLRNVFTFVAEKKKHKNVVRNFTIKKNRFSWKI